MRLRSIHLERALSQTTVAGMAEKRTPKPPAFVEELLKPYFAESLGWALSHDDALVFLRDVLREANLVEADLAAATNDLDALVAWTWADESEP